MREILFRGKRIDNGEWVYGAYHKHDTVKVCITGDDSKPKHLIVADGFCDWGFEPPLMCYNVDPKTVGQYTGLTDENGKKIFEGDIVHSLHSVHSISELELVGYCGGGFSPFAIPGWECTPDGSDTEVIGNVHDNPELLGGADNGT